eukprot:CAMPEP_0119306448 /NCGR_PEP_ID=MMETSP1333-20130426/7211_1 /TAXON_ID=418940 /ORGANISM="Scyphosphaera apsteinii, Strain RCC1455" /LENGTH=144 /DNA_ID=CAMNT_0007309757 /DNA_START=135 /DNA_END=569 /DNA_ORIENTATION=+
MTCGVEFGVKLVPVAEKTGHCELHVFDSGGQDVFEDMMPRYWGGASAVLVVYDATRQHTFDAASARLQLVLEALGKESLPGAIVANKMDLHERLVVPRQAGLRLAEQTGLHFFETSAYDGEGVEEPFKHIATELFNADGKAAIY